VNFSRISGSSEGFLGSSGDYPEVPDI